MKNRMKVMEKNGPATMSRKAGGGTGYQGCMYGVGAHDMSEIKGTPRAGAESSGERVWQNPQHMKTRMGKPITAQLDNRWGRRETNTSGAPNYAVKAGDMGPRDARRSDGDSMGYRPTAFGMMTGGGAMMGGGMDYDGDKDNSPRGDVEDDDDSKEYK